MKCAITMAKACQSWWGAMAVIEQSAVKKMDDD